MCYSRQLQLRLSHEEAIRDELQKGKGRLRRGLFVARCGIDAYFVMLKI